MLEFRFHGRGGQGAVTSAELLALSAIAEGKFAQAFPSFGPERRGAPVVAYARIDEAKVLNRTAVSTPNVVVVLDPSILRIVNTSEGMVDGGTQIVNTSRTAAEVREAFKLKGRLVTVNANRIAAEEIGRVITNTTMLGALVRAMGVVKRDTIVEHLKERFGRIAAGNIKAFLRAYEECVIS
ncbi:MAG: 2-oxoacid:acceptor oxidoreductase family protein [Deltaproteobacteria bacterium]|nr:2-oxoacid:acceptor oxidoreductase family protein [Deltaproteobacteria bacterium]